MDPQRVGPSHRYHAAILECLADEGNIFYHTLGSGVVYCDLRHCKSFRNKFRNRIPDDSNVHKLLDTATLPGRTDSVVLALTESVNQARAATGESFIESTLGIMRQEHHENSKRFWELFAYDQKSRGIQIFDPN